MQSTEGKGQRELFEALKDAYKFYMEVPTASGDFTCTCNKPIHCGICEIRERTKKVLEAYSQSGAGPKDFLVRCHKCKGTQIYKRISDSEIEVYHCCDQLSGAGSPEETKPEPLGNCETPHFLGEPTEDRKALTQTPHYPLPQDRCKNWRPLSEIPMVMCPHERLDEDGVCRQCGADCRGVAESAPEETKPATGLFNWYTQVRKNDFLFSKRMRVVKAMERAMAAEEATIMHEESEGEQP